MSWRAWGLLIIVTSATASCSARGAVGDDGGIGFDVMLDSRGALDSGPTLCTSDTECDDGFPCTIDECVVGNVCRNDPQDTRCTSEERCVVGRGCVTGSGTTCETAVDCDDGRFCNGPENCIRNMCVPDRAVDCNDGNACTIDSCDDGIGGCHYEVAEGCDGGVITSDAGPMCDPFDPTMDYGGSFDLLPGQACDGGFDSYTVNSASFSIAGGTLTVTAGRFALHQTPAPTGADFDVSGSDGCASVRIMAHFECDARFRGTWTATHSGGCGMCGTLSGAIVGRRR